MVCGEFDLITRFFAAKHIERSDVKLGIGDDCALLIPPAKQLLAVSTDTLVSGVHFYADIDPADLAYKAVMVNLSDLAAMGATPAWISLALTLPEVNGDWLQRFSDSFFSVLEYYQMQLIGGDTTKGPLSLTLTVQGFVPEGRQFSRSGAKIGDWIYVTGWLGDSAAGLAILDKRLQVSNLTERDYLLKRHLRPEARVLMGQRLRDLTSSAIDLSDGLIADLQHILNASHCGAKIDLAAIPISAALANNAPLEQVLCWALSGGEDYELCFTVPEMHKGALDLHLASLGVPYTCIGQITPPATKMRFFRQGKEVIVDWRGYDHFGEQ